MLIGDIRDPIIGIDIIDAEEIEAIDAEPCVLHGRLAVASLVEAIAHTNVGTLICRGTEIHGFF